MINCGQRALHLAGRTHHQTSRRNDRALCHQGSRCDDAATANDRAVQDDATHPDEDVRLDCAAVQRYRMTHSHVVTQGQRILILHHVEHRPILDIRAAADTDVVHVATHHGPWPHARVLADHDVADDDRRWIDVGRSRNLRKFAAIWAYVRFALQRPWSPGKLLQRKDICHPASSHAHSEYFKIAS